MFFIYMFTYTPAPNFKLFFLILYTKCLFSKKSILYFFWLKPNSRLSVPNTHTELFAPSHSHLVCVFCISNFETGKKIENRVLENPPWKSRNPKIPTPWISIRYSTWPDWCSPLVSIIGVRTDNFNFLFRRKYTFGIILL